MWDKRGRGAFTFATTSIIIINIFELVLLDFFMITMISVPWLASWLVKIRGGFGGGGDVCGELLLSSFTFFAEAQLSTEGWFVLVSSSPSP